MADGVTIELLGEQALLARLDHAIQSVEHPEQLLDNIGAMLVNNIEHRFDEKKDPTGAAWSPLKRSTLDRYAKLYDGNIPGSLLERTRHMRDSLNHQVGAGYVDVGFGDPKAAYFEFGTKKMERRGLLTANPEAGELGAADRAEVFAEIEAYLAAMLD